MGKKEIKAQAQWNEQNRKIAEELKRNVHERKERKKENFCHTLFYYISILYVAYIFFKERKRIFWDLSFHTYAIHTMYGMYY